MRLAWKARDSFLGSTNILILANNLDNLEQLKKLVEEPLNFTQPPVALLMIEWWGGLAGAIKVVQGAHGGKSVTNRVCGAL